MINFSICSAIFSIMGFSMSWYVLFMVSLALVRWLLIFVISKFMSSFMTSYVCSVASWKHSSTAFSLTAFSTGMEFRWLDVFVLFLYFFLFFFFIYSLLVWSLRLWRDKYILGLFRTPFGCNKFLLVHV